MDYAFIYTLGFLVIVNVAKIHAEQCPMIYLRYNKDHSYCKTQNTSCNIISSFPSPKDIEQILELHNTFRSVVGTQQENSNVLPAAANMLQMEWDDELAAVAQNYANTCIYAHDCANCRRVRNFGVGQNIALQRLTGYNLDAPPPDWSFAVGDWFAEIVYSNKDLICPFKPPTGGEYRHFSQLVWAETFRIGCGYTLYKHGNSWTSLYICNYGPGGNIYDTCVYAQGPPCSQCPSNTCCGDTCKDGKTTYPGLCRRVNNEAPVEIFSKPALLDCDYQDPAKEDCLMNALGDGRWYVIPALGGNYLEIVLNGGQNSTLEFSKTIQPISKSFCVQLRYRKGPNLEANPENNNAVATLVIPTMNDYTFSQPLPSYQNPGRQQFSHYKLNLQWDAATRFKISFSVPPGADPQFFNIDSVKAFDSGCSD